MKKLVLTVLLEYDDTIMHGEDADSIAWFYNNVLSNPKDGCGLILHSNEIGDEVGSIRVIKIRDELP